MESTRAGAVPVDVGDEIAHQDDGSHTHHTHAARGVAAMELGWFSGWAARGAGSRASRRHAARISGHSFHSSHPKRSQAHQKSESASVAALAAGDKVNGSGETPSGVPVGDILDPWGHQ
ncbi:hypothetical protein FALBO_4229 [Fusarium albosuccineum]|uniref:Uncharacterized protein n=1 Tax=Fusarium albosuccineum TaxID=1237068 RepID=A0A8H4PGK2_9HYPO|nr:hypothetical protein FALBO_4229 [Fusarium albosuccineum]